MPDSLRLDLDEHLDAALARAAARTGQSAESLALQLLRRGLAPEPGRVRLFCSAPVNALVEGIYQQDTTIAELKRHGDFGLGTFNDLDGEMLVLDGQVFQVRADGHVYAVDDAERTPFACVTFFTPDTAEPLPGPLDFQAFTTLLLDRLIPSLNMLYAIRVQGDFSHVKTRSVPRQENYRPLVEVAREQPVFEYTNIEGTLAGFYTPEYMASIAVPGIHLHFLSKAGDCGGHLLSCSIERAVVSLQHVPRLELALPLTLDYLTAAFSRDTDRDLQQAER